MSTNTEPGGLAVLGPGHYEAVAGGRRGRVTSPRVSEGQARAGDVMLRLGEAGVVVWRHAARRGLAAR